MKLMILDGNSIVNRAFYGIRVLNAPDGTPTNGVYGFLSILHRLLSDEKPDALCVAFDLSAPTFRHERYKGYKARRHGMPEELAVQLPILKRVLDAMGVLRLECEGWEADDIIGTVARICGETGRDCVVVTGDKDSFQLITDRVTVKHIKSRMGKTETTDYTPERFSEEYGFAPPKIVDLKALMGDSSDNIPGVPGVGEKTALELVRRFGSLDGVYENLDSPEIKPGVRKKLAEGRESAYLSFELATIMTNAPVGFSPEDARFEPDYGPELYDIFTELGFSRFIEQWGVSHGGQPPEAEPAPALPVVSVPDEPGADALFTALEGRAELAVFAENGPGALEICDGERVYAVRGAQDRLLKRLFSEKRELSSCNVKDLTVRLLDAGTAPEADVFDVSLAGYLLDPTAGNYSPAALAAKYLPAKKDGAEAVFALRGPLSAELREKGMERLFLDIELPLCRVLADMERAGFLVDREALSKFGESLSAGIEELYKSVCSLAGEEFNINSPRQLASVLFEKLGLPSGKKTKTGRSTNADVLEKLRGRHPIIEQILDYRALTKLKSTYADGLLKVIAPDGRVHTRFQMTATATGRLSSAEPNLQNIPVRTELGGEIRRMFVAAPGNVLVDADYSQIELRVLAHISGDETMINAFLNGEDIHAVTASQVFGVPLSGVTGAQRSRAKAVNFGIVYGISAFSLAQDIKTTREEAQAYIDAYLEKYHGVRDYMKRVVEQAKADGYVTTLFGRRRPLPELSASNRNLRAFGERAALNTPIQGTAADIMKLAMVNVHRRLTRECPEARLLLQVHDELIAECPERCAETVKRILTEEMEGAVKLSVPLTAEAHAAGSWHDAK